MLLFGRCPKKMQAIELSAIIKIGLSIHTQKLELRGTISHYAYDYILFSKLNLITRW